MTSTDGDLVQGLLLEIARFQDRYHSADAISRSLDEVSNNLLRLHQLAEAVDVAVGGFVDLPASETARIPKWLVGRPGDGRGPGGLLDRLENHPDLVDTVRPLLDAVTGVDIREMFARIRDALLPVTDRADEARVAASPGSRLADPPGVTVPIVYQANGAGATLRLSPIDVPGRSGDLSFDDLPLPVLTLIGEGPWQPDFLAGIDNGRHAARSLLAQLGRPPRKSADVPYRLAGIFGSPELASGSAALPVALDVLARALPELSRRPPASTGVLALEEDTWQLEPMDVATVESKLEAVKLVHPGRAGASDRFTWMIAPADGPVSGVDRLFGCAHGAPAQLREAARSAWGSAWIQLLEQQRRRIATEHGLEIGIYRENAVRIGGESFWWHSRLEEETAAHFRQQAEATDQSFRATWGVIGDHPETGRTWAALGAAERLEAEGWHVLTLRCTDAVGELPDPSVVARLADLSLPRGCRRSLVVLDDVRVPPPTSGGEDLGRFAEHLNDLGYHALLVVEGWSGVGDRQGDVGWGTDHAPFSREGLTRSQRQDLLGAVARAAGVTVPESLVPPKGTLNARLSWMVDEINRRDGRADLERPALQMPDRADKHAHTVFAAVAALSRLGMRFDPAYVERVRTARDITRLGRMTRWEADAVLEQAEIPGGRDLETKMGFGLLDFFRWALPNDRRTIAAIAVHRLTTDRHEKVLRFLFGDSRSEMNGRLSWEDIEPALESTDYYGIARLAAELVRHLPGPRRRQVVERLALAIVDGAGESERPDHLAFAITVLEEQRAALQDTVDEHFRRVRLSLDPRRVSAALEASPWIGARLQLVRALGRLHGDDAWLLDVIERTRDDFFATTRPSAARELGAALQLHDEIERTRRVHRARENLVADHRWLAHLVDQRPDDTWRFDARLALAALQHRFSATPPDARAVADFVIRSARTWNVHQLTVGLGYLSAASPRLAEGVLREAQRLGLAEVLRARLPLVPPTVAADCLSFLIRLDPAGAWDMQYTVSAGGPQPRADYADAVARQMTRYPDAKGVSKLFLAFANILGEFETPVRTFAQDVVDRLGHAFIITVLQGQRRSVVHWMIDALVRNSVRAEGFLAERMLDTVLQQVTEGRITDSWTPSIALSLLSAEEQGLFVLDRERTVSQELAAVLRRDGLILTMREARSAEVLDFSDRLASYLEAERDTAWDERAAVDYATRFRSWGCPLCRLDKKRDALTALTAARTITLVLHRGGRHDASGEVAALVREHFFQHVRERPARWRVYTPGTLAEILRLVREVAPDMAGELPWDRWASLLGDAAPTEAARIFKELGRLGDRHVARVRELLEKEGAWDRLFDRLEREDVGPRARFTAVRQLEETVGEPSGERRRRVHDAMVNTAASTRSVPLLGEALRGVARRDRDKAASIARQRFGRVLPDLYPVRGDDRPTLVTLVGILQALHARKGAEALLASALERSEFKRVPAGYLVSYIDRSVDLDVRDRGRLYDQAVTMLTKLATFGEREGGQALRDLGELAHRLAIHRGEVVRLPRTPTPALGREDPVVTLWGLAFVDFPGWSTQWDVTLERVGAMLDALGPAQSAMALAAASYRGASGAFASALTDLVWRAAEAPRRWHRALATVLDAGESADIEVALLKHRSEWLTALLDPRRNADPDRESIRRWLLVRSGTA